MTFTVILLGVVLPAAVVAVAAALMARAARHSAERYKSALELSQKRLDHQTSRLNILAHALPNLQSLIAQSAAMDGWQALALDEARALVRAVSAGYWRYLERENVLEFELGREIENGIPRRIAVDTGDAAAEAARTRTPVLRAGIDAAGGESVAALPVVVSGQLAGVVRISSHGNEAIGARDLELLAMFYRQVTIAIENRDLVHKRETFYLELVQTLADILDSRDASSLGQTKQARRLARAVARELELPDEFTYFLEFAALMHDIGKIGIDDQLLRKPGKLTPEEFEIMKTHPELGYKILAPVTMLAPVAPMVLYHQEWFNGKGYPEGLSGEEIPLGARIVAVLDAWCAMTSVRPWRSALSKRAAVHELKKGAGTQFDPKVVEAFLAALEKQGIAAAEA